MGSERGHFEFGNLVWTVLGDEDHLWEAVYDSEHGLEEDGVDRRKRNLNKLEIHEKF